MTNEFCKQGWWRGVAMVLCAAGLLAAQSMQSQSKPGREVILISIDGMTTADYLHADEHGLKIPNLRAFEATGCPADGMTGVFPTVTYPSHTAMITGEPPSVHGIYSNTPLDPFGLESGGWFYYAEEIRSPTLWQVLHKAGIKTAAISWPVTVGADIDYLLPEYRPVRTPEDVALMDALSTPGLFQEMMKLDPTDHPMSDPWRTKAAIAILETRHPGLLALHLSALDSAQHRYGPHSPEAHATLETIDGEIGQIRSAVAKEGRLADTSWVIVSDHGFLPIDKLSNPMVVLHDAGLITTNKDGKVTDWKVYGLNEGGSFFLEARDPNDTASVAKATELMRKLASDPANGIAAIYTPADLKAMDANPKAFLALEAERGFGFGSNLNGPVVTPSPGKGTHGYNPDIPELRPSMILSGAGIFPCKLREGVNIVDVGPTVAALLGVSMTGTQGHNINQPVQR